jgi:hypothetical protein
MIKTIFQTIEKYLSIKWILVTDLGDLKRSSSGIHG